MRQQLMVPVEVFPQEDSPGYLAVCPTIPGCHAEGATVGEALDCVMDVARTLLEIMEEDGMPWLMRPPLGSTLPMVGHVTVPLA